LPEKPLQSARKILPNVGQSGIRGHLKGVRMNTEPIEEKFNKLPEHLKKEVIDFIDFLTKKHAIHESSGNFNFNWEGALSKLKKEYSAVDLQHKAAEWR
jgi:hypothetical protein